MAQKRLDGLLRTRDALEIQTARMHAEMTAARTRTTILAMDHSIMLGIGIPGCDEELAAARRTLTALQSSWLDACLQLNTTKTCILLEQNALEAERLALAAKVSSAALDALTASTRIQRPSASYPRNYKRQRLALLTRLATTDAAALEEIQAIKAQERLVERDRRRVYRAKKGAQALEVKSGFIV